MREKRVQVATAALDLVKDSNTGDEVFIVNFGDEANIGVDFTSVQARMSQALTKIDSHVHRHARRRLHGDYPS